MTISVDRKSSRVVAKSARDPEVAAESAAITTDDGLESASMSICIGAVAESAGARVTPFIVPTVAMECGLLRQSVSSVSLIRSACDCLWLPVT